MTHSATVTLDDDGFAFLNAISGHNRSAYINQLLKQERDKSLREAVLKANEQEANDTDYQAELDVWENTLSDGLIS